MSALGQKQTSSNLRPMSALPPIADMCSAQANVRFVPIADIDKLHHVLVMSSLVVAGQLAIWFFLYMK